MKNLIDRLPDGINTYITRNFNTQGIELSGGENQKLAIARAIYKNSPILILDEPTASLDSENRQIVIKLLKECALNGAIVILATHDDRLVNECSKVIDMSRL